MNRRMMTSLTGTALRLQSNGAWGPIAGFPSLALRLMCVDCLPTVDSCTACRKRPLTALQPEWPDLKSTVVGGERLIR
jgi:hypothetical protein